MIKLQKHINELMAVFMAMLVLFSVSGFSIHSHYCSHGEQANYSLYLPAEGCNDSSEKEAICCQPLKVSCCSQEKETPATEDCCSNEAKYAKLNIQTLLNHSIVEIKTMDFALIFLLNGTFSPNFATNNFIIGHAFLKESPPTLSTLEYLSKIQVYII